MSCHLCMLIVCKCSDIEYCLMCLSTLNFQRRIPQYKLLKKKVGITKGGVKMCTYKTGNI